MKHWPSNVLVAISVVASLAACGTSGTSQSAPPAPAPASSSVSLPLPTAGAAGSRSPICGPADLVARRMGMKDITVYTDLTDPNHLLGRQGEYTSKVEWTTDGETSGIEAFADTTDAELRYAYLRLLRPPIGDGYDYLYRAALLRLASIYTPAQAAALKASFESACRESS
jgi:hypothetical protein